MVIATRASGRARAAEKDLICRPETIVRSCTESGAARSSPTLAQGYAGRAKACLMATTIPSSRRPARPRFRISSRRGTSLLRRHASVQLVYHERYD